jgi:hypothetical protein
MKCKEVQKRLEFGLTAEGIDLPEDIRAHVDSCAECSAFLAQLESIGTELGPAQVTGLTAEEEMSLRHGIEERLAAIDNITNVKKRAARWARLIPKVAIPVAAAAALVLAVVMQEEQGVQNGAASGLISPAELDEFTDNELAMVYYDMGNDEENGLIEQAAFSQIAGEIDPLAADDVIESASEEELQWLMDNLSMEMH